MNVDVLKIIAELRAERDRLDEAITSLEQLAGTRKLRGRPPLHRPGKNGNGADVSKPFPEQT